MSVVTEVDLGSFERVEKDRSVKFEWHVGTKPSDADHRGETQVLAVLNVSHHKAGANMFSGEMTTSDYFDVTIGQETAADCFNRAGEKIGEMRGFKLFAATRVARYDAGSRFSKKRLMEAADKALADFTDVFQSGDERVLRYFEEREV